VYIIKATFLRFCDLHISNLFDMNGVYVIWDSQAIARPSYIGEGHILKRLSDHARTSDFVFSKPIDGYIATVSGSTQNVHKTESLAVERLLLDVADVTDRKPAMNSHPGNSSVLKLFCRSGQLRISISGYDPLIPPQEGRTLKRSKIINVLPSKKYEYEIEHDWSMRRRRVI